MKQKNFIRTWGLNSILICFFFVVLLSGCKGKKIINTVVETVSKKNIKSGLKADVKEFETIMSKENIPENVVKKIGKDASESPMAEHALKMFKSEPKLIKVYERLAHLPDKFKYDENLLRWISEFEKLPRTFRKDIELLHFTTDELGQYLSIRIKNKEVAIFQDGILKCDAGITKGSVNLRVASNPILNLPLMRNSTYKVDGQFIYKTNELGQTISVSTTQPLKLLDRGRNIRAQSWVVNMKNGILRNKERASDAAGHIIAQRFNGPSELINFFPQLPKMNLGEWKVLEDVFAKLTKEGHKIMPRYRLIYGNQSLRPISIEVSYRIDGGKEITKEFSNI